MEFKKVKERLRTYNALQSQIRFLEADAIRFSKEIYAPLKSTMRATASYVDTSKTALILSMCNDIISRMYERIEELKRAQSVIFDAIRQLSFLEQAVVSCYYIHGLSWIEVSAKLHFSERQLQRVMRSALSNLNDIWFGAVA